ncbi:MAG: hypothetical protein Q8S73_10590 [Deltaproteobacteria bacterium]|nr:hypothetical protein [Myxococcales bacterium]MDP3214541.1 hypothetical protein [Deltaproteobacteria bacterium]
MRVPVVGTIVAWKTDYATVLRHNRLVRGQMKGVGETFSRLTDVVETVPRSLLRRGGHLLARTAHRSLSKKSPEWHTVREQLAQTSKSPSDAELALRRLFQDAAAKDRKAAAQIALYATPASAATVDRTEYFEAVKTMGKVHGVLELSGEERVDELLAIMARSEKVLSKTLFVVFLLLEISTGVIPSTLSDKDREFGTLRARIEDHPRFKQYPNLLPPWLRHLRNAACHGKDRYIEEDDTVVWWDRKTAHAPEIISAIDLWEKVAEVVHLSSIDLPNAAQSHVLTSLPGLELLASPAFALRALELLAELWGTDSIQSETAARSLEELLRTYWERASKFD